MKYSINGDVGVDYEDCGQWRSYDADGNGDTIQEFLDSITIAEVDQDGGEINCYSFYDAGYAIQKQICNLVGISYDTI